MAAVLARLGGGPAESLTKYWNKAIKDIWGHTSQRKDLAARALLTASWPLSRGGSGGQARGC